MRAVFVSANGGVDHFDLAEAPEPSVAPETVLVRVEVSGINFIDVYQRSGLYPSALPFHAGVEGVGIIVAVGGGVSDLVVGQRVGSFSGGQGSFDDVVRVQADRVVPIPDDLDPATAVALLMQGTTAHYLAVDAYPSRTGTVALVHAAAGGVGLLLIQILKHLGATVIATASTQEKREAARAVGADHVLSYEQFPEAVRTLTGGTGVDVVYDGVGAATAEGSLASLRVRGTLVFYGNASGAVPPLDVTRLSGLGSLYITRPTIAHYTRTRAELRARTDELFDWQRAGLLRVQPPQCYALEEIHTAFRALESRATIGKLVLMH